MSHTIRVHGDFKRTYKFLEKVAKPFYRAILDKYGKLGVDHLRATTPKHTGKTAESWSYRVEEEPGGATIIWENSNVVKYVNIAIILQYGHGTRFGGFVEGIDYINPALRPVFEGLAHDLWEEVETS